MAGDQQQPPHGRRLGHAEFAPGHQPADDAVVRGVLLDLGQLGQILDQFISGRHDLGSRRTAVQQDAAAFLEVVVVLVGHAEQPADHQGRQRQRELRDQVGRRPGGGHPVEQVVGEAPDLGTHRLDLLDHEVGGEHPAQPGVVRVVHPDEARLAPCELLASGG
ncbi:hypothetical protein [Streptomyces scopuliridis]|uniref:hypothetical protein n=1 Tax=Streptomyces scopuliridis TaxID=452529 RepID=UPI0035D97EE2